jgi:hypothetical protein
VITNYTNRPAIVGIHGLDNVDEANSVKTKHIIE